MSKPELFDWAAQTDEDYAAIFPSNDREHLALIEYLKDQDAERRTAAMVIWLIISTLCLWIGLAIGLGIGLWVAN